MMTSKIRLAVVGLGYWGPNLLRAAGDLDDFEVTMLCDLNEEFLEKHGRRFPAARLTSRFEDVLEDKWVDAVLIATPVKTHYEIADRCLRAGRHVFVEKPITTSSEEAIKLIKIATDKQLILMPGHTFLYSPPVVRVKELLDQHALGRIFFVTSTRVNLGIHHRESSVIQDLAPHDFSILHYWMGMPTFTRAIARDSIVPGLWDVAFVDLGYAASGILVRTELSWLAPSKLRRTVIAGSRAMVVYDDTSNEPLRVYDRGAELAQPHNFGEHRMTYRIGDVVSPHLTAEEPLRVELADFAASIRSGNQPRSNMQLGLEVVMMMEAAETSLAYNGAPVPVIRHPGDRRAVPDRRNMFNTFDHYKEQIQAQQVADDASELTQPSNGSAAAMTPDQVEVVLDQPPSNGVATDSDAPPSSGLNGAAEPPAAAVNGNGERPPAAVSGNGNGAPPPAAAVVNGNGEPPAAVVSGNGTPPPAAAVVNGNGNGAPPPPPAAVNGNGDGADGVEPAEPPVVSVNGLGEAADAVSESGGPELSVPPV
ncbi:MAG: Gfo/Idh/MocA family oxidoreductase [Solirubrobacteraceae bacterium]